MRIRQTLLSTFYVLRFVLWTGNTIVIKTSPFPNGVYIPDWGGWEEEKKNRVSKSTSGDGWQVV